MSKETGNQCTGGCGGHQRCDHAGTGMAVSLSWINLNDTQMGLIEKFVGRCWRLPSWWPAAVVAALWARKQVTPRSAEDSNGRGRRDCAASNGADAPGDAAPRTTRGEAGDGPRSTARP